MATAKTPIRKKVEAQARQLLDHFNGNEEAAIRFLQENPETTEAEVVLLRKVFKELR